MYKGKLKKDCCWKRLEPIRVLSFLYQLFFFKRFFTWCCCKPSPWKKKYFHGFIKGAHCLGSDELVFEKAFETVCYEIHMVRKIFYIFYILVENNDPHKYDSKLVVLLGRELPWSAILWMADRVSWRRKRKTVAISKHASVDHLILL